MERFYSLPRKARASIEAARFGGAPRTTRTETTRGEHLSAFSDVCRPVPTKRGALSHSISRKFALKRVRTCVGTHRGWKRACDRFSTVSGASRRPSGPGIRQSSRSSPMGKSLMRCLSRARIVASFRTWLPLQTRASSSSSATSPTSSLHRQTPNREVTRASHRRSGMRSRSSISEMLSCVATPAVAEYGHCSDRLLLQRPSDDGWRPQRLRWRSGASEARSIRRSPKTIRCRKSRRYSNFRTFSPTSMSKRASPPGTFASTRGGSTFRRAASLRIRTNVDVTSQSWTRSASGPPQPPPSSRRPWRTRCRLRGHVEPRSH